MVRKWFAGVNMDMDEMLLSRQRQSASRAFWVLLALAHAFCFFQVLVLAQDFSQFWPTFSLAVCGTVIYVVMVFRARIPLLPRLPRRLILWGVLGFSAAMGVFVGVRNVFFLYAQNMVRYAVSTRIWVAVQIAALMTVEFALAMALDFAILVLLNAWQNRRIARVIALENED